MEVAVEVERVCPVASEVWKERAFGFYPLHQPRFPVESREFPALHAPFLKRKAHTCSCPELCTGNRGNRRVPHAATAGKSICASRGIRSHPSRYLRRVG